MQFRIGSGQSLTYEFAIYCHRMAVAFGQLLKDCLEEAELTQTEFARRTGLALSFINNIVQGERTPPPAKLEQFADILGLRGTERDHFLDTAMITHMPSEVQARFVILLQRVEAYEKARRQH